VLTGNRQIFKEENERRRRAQSGAASVHVLLWGLPIPLWGVAVVAPLFLGEVAKKGKV